MPRSLFITAVAVPVVGIFLTLLIFFIRNRCSSKRRTSNFAEKDITVPAGKFSDPESKRPRPGFTNHYLEFRFGASGSMPGQFNWADYPSLITDAVENGWVRFAFRGARFASPSVRSALIGFCAAGDHRDPGGNIEMGWEIGAGTAEFVQTIRFNPGMNNTRGDRTASVSASVAAAVIRTGLPLPGPPLGNSSFPQEAYFEITVFGTGEDCVKKSIGEGEKTKLINGGDNLTVEDAEKYPIEEEGDESVMLSLGLTTGASLPLKLPGSYPQSIGFHSNGRIYLNGVKLAPESAIGEWRQRETVVGCGFKPSDKKVFFTVDSEVVRVIQCESSEFGGPLFPTLAANADVSVVVNFGQQSFKYSPANQHRTANPCFTKHIPISNPRGAAASGSCGAGSIGFEDSKELFSMGRIDAHWHSRSAAAKTSFHTNSHFRKETGDFDQDSEGDLFEIVLED